MIDPSIFSTLLLQWFHTNGRKNLPWQRPRTPYRVWVSEVMLQQTQVNTVIPYFEKFMQAFPTVYQLAEAKEDTLLHLWSGLGYYARVRHLHQAARQIIKEFNGELPCDGQALQSLPGIGRSTAGAILSLGFNQPAVILDGNVKRIFSRLHAIAAPLNSSAITKQLWHLAESYLPLTRPADYTQSLMDFGSLLCTRRNPRCHDCPMTSRCLAFIKNQTSYYPYTKRSQPLPTRHIHFVILINQQRKILLEKRPPIGIWGGLWSVPECQLDTPLEVWCEKHYHCSIKSMHSLPTVQHLFSHFRLVIQPILCYVSTMKHSLANNSAHNWFTQAECSEKGLATPVKALLSSIFSEVKSTPPMK